MYNVDEVSGFTPEQIKHLESRSKQILKKMKSPEFEPLTKVIQLKLNRLFDTLKKSDDIKTIRYIQGQISVYEAILNDITS